MGTYSPPAEGGRPARSGNGTIRADTSDRSVASRHRGIRFVSLLICLAFAAPLYAHDIITTPVTWNREMSRIFFSRCVACHRDGGSAFSMAQYRETFPWRTAIKEEILERRMPPWGAVKGFGDFRNDQALTPEQL